ncbi:hypothetical protein DFH09DRAFT_957860, partial [Mycena vulgaris]
AGSCARDVASAVLPPGTTLTATDGSTLTSIAVPMGTSIMIAIAKANHNPYIWGMNAREFRPERWVNGRMGSKDVKLPGVWGGTMTSIGGGWRCMCVFVSSSVAMRRKRLMGYTHSGFEVLAAGDECIFYMLCFRELVLTYGAEVVLCVLLRSFKFPLSDKDVKFHILGGIIGPTVDGETVMPLMIEKVAP